MKCSKCGNILDEKELYCSKCGLININNPNNKVIKDMAQECIKEDLKKQTKLRKFLKYINDSKKILIITNIIFYIISVILYIKNVHNTFDTWFNVFIISFIYFYIICFEVIFKKASFSPYSIFIPLFNIYLFFKLAFYNGYLSLIICMILFLHEVAYALTFVGIGSQLLTILFIISILIIPLLLFFIGRRFNRSGTLTMLFWFVIIPSIAFSKKYKYTYKERD